MPCTCLPFLPLPLSGVSLRLPCVPFRGDLSHFSHRRKQQSPRHKSTPRSADWPAGCYRWPATGCTRARARGRRKSRGCCCCCTKFPPQMIQGQQAGGQKTEDGGAAAAAAEGSTTHLRFGGRNEQRRVQVRSPSDFSSMRTTKMVADWRELEGRGRERGGGERGRHVNFNGLCLLRCAVRPSRARPTCWTATERASERGADSPITLSGLSVRASFSRRQQ